MDKTTNMQRRAARAMKRAIHEGVDPRNTVTSQGKVYKRLCSEDLRRKPWTMSEAIHIHEFDWDGSQTCECGARFD